MVGYRWTEGKPTAAGWYWFRGLAHEADPFIVQVDEVGQFQWPDGGFQEVTLAKRGMGVADPATRRVKRSIGLLGDFSAPGTRTIMLCSFDGRKRNLPRALCTESGVVG